MRRIRVRGGNFKLRALRLDTGVFSWPSEGIARQVRIQSVVYNGANNEFVRTNTLVKGEIVRIDAAPFRLWYESYYGVALSGKAKKTKEAKTKKGSKSSALPATKKAAALVKKAAAKKAPAAKEGETKKEAAKPKEGAAKKEAAKPKVAGAKKEAAKPKAAGGKKEAAKPKEGAKKEATKKAGSKKEEITKKKRISVESGIRTNKSALLRYKKRAARCAIETHFEEQFATGALLAAISSRPGQTGRVDGYLLEGKELEFYQRKVQKR